MTNEEATEILKKMYDNPITDKVMSIHLFGIKYAKEMKEKTTKDLHEIANSATNVESYPTEIRKGIKLSEYVEIKKNVVI